MSNDNTPEPWEVGKFSVDTFQIVPRQLQVLQIRAPR